MSLRPTKVYYDTNYEITSTSYDYYEPCNHHAYLEATPIHYQPYTPSTTGYERAEDDGTMQMEYKAPGY